MLTPQSLLLVPLALCDDTERAIRCATRLTVQYGATMSLIYGHESEDDLRREAADLIIISVMDQAIEPAVERAIRCAPCPVLVVHKSGARLFWQGPHQADATLQAGCATGGNGRRGRDITRSGR